MTFSRKKPVGYPEISFLSFDIQGLLRNIQSKMKFNSIGPVSITLQTMETLACIRHSKGDSGGDIYLHSLFNRPEVPQPVIEHILCHELLHLRIPAREVQGKLTHHPPEFWEAEKDLVPWVATSWEWMSLAFWEVIKIDHLNECVWVKKSWRKHQTKPYPSWQSVLDDSRKTSDNESRVKSLMETL